MEDTIFEGLQNKNKLNITHELVRFIEVDDSVPVTIADLERHKEVLKVVRPKFNRKFAGRDHPRRCGRTDVAHGRSMNAAHSSTSPMWVPADGSHRSWTRIDTQHVKPFAVVSWKYTAVKTRFPGANDRAKTLWEVSSESRRRETHRTIRPPRSRS